MTDREGGAHLDFERVKAEVRTKAELGRGDFSRWQRPGRGAHRVREELVGGDPGRLFLFRLGTTWHAGYKTLSDYVLEGDMPGLLCSRVYWHNVLGLLDNFRVSDTDVTVSFFPLDEPGRRQAFEGITETTPIVHPFPTYGERGMEEISPPDGWPVTDERAASLGRGEEHLRRYTRELFRPAAAALGADITVFDPACSTGHFLADFARLNPARIRTIGQDLSRQMVDYASDRIETVHHGDAMHPRVETGSIDMLFCRFLNSEVVSTQRARKLLPRLAATLRPGGTMVLLGHSPVLLDVLDLEAVGLHVLQTTGRQDDYVFQYYVCGKPS